MIANFYGNPVDLATLRRRFTPSIRGVSLSSVITVADTLDLTSQPVQVSLENLSALTLPVILHWDLNHFVVLEKIRRGRMLIHDPKGQSRWMNRAEMSPHFTGIALELSPAARFLSATPTSQLRLRDLDIDRTRLSKGLAQVLALSVIMQMTTLASPYYLQAAIDYALAANDLNSLTALAIGFAGIATILAGVTIS